MNSKWDYRFIDHAAIVANWSKDPSTQTGAVIVRPDNTIASQGYNGFPKNIKDDTTLLANREEKYKRIVHCEMNALIFAREPLEGYTLYTWPFLSCSRCAVHMIQAGIAKAIAPTLPKELEERWAADLELTKSLFKEAGVTYYTYDYF
jgi:dCMP deaminase